MSRLPTDAKARKDIPLATGCLDYFPDALAAVAALSKVANEQHNPGEPLHWARGKSMDQADTLLRHLVERGTVDTDGVRHSTKVAWRALALLQIELEAANGLPPSRGSKSEPGIEVLENVAYVRAALNLKPAPAVEFDLDEAQRRVAYGRTVTVRTVTAESSGLLLGAAVRKNALGTTKEVRYAGDSTWHDYSSFPEGYHGCTFVEEEPKHRCACGAALTADQPYCTVLATCPNYCPF